MEAIVLEEKTLKEIKTRIIYYQNREIIKTKNNPKFTEFFLKNAENSIESAKVLFEITTNPEKQKQFGFTNFNGLLWVVNASYYSMFYMTRALLENEGVNLNILRSYPHPRGVSLRSPASLCFAVGHYTSKNSLSLNFVLLFEIYGWFTAACP